MTLPCRHSHPWSCSTSSPVAVHLNAKFARHLPSVSQCGDVRRSQSVCRPQLAVHTRSAAVTRANGNRRNDEQRLASENAKNDAAPVQDQSADDTIGEDQKVVLGQKKIAQWMATSAVRPAAAMSIEELKNAQISWQDTYKSKKQAKSSQPAARGGSKQKQPVQKTKAATPARSRGFGVLSDSSTIKLFRYCLEKAALQQILLEAGLSKKVLQVERIEDADAIIAIKLDKKGQHVNLQQAERTAMNAGIPLVIVGRRLSKDSVLKAIKPLLDKRSSASSTDALPSGDSEEDDWAQLEPADEFEQWDPDDLDSDVFDDEIKGFKTARSGNIPGHNPKKAPRSVNPQTAPGGSIQAGSISFGRQRTRAS